MQFNCYENLGELGSETLVCGQKQCLYFQLSSARQGYWKNSECKKAELSIDSKITRPATESPVLFPAEIKSYVYTSHPPTHTVSMPGKEDMLNQQICMFYRHRCILYRLKEKELKAILPN